MPQTAFSLDANDIGNQTTLLYSLGVRDYTLVESKKLFLDLEFSPRNKWIWDSSNSPSYWIKW